MINQIKREMERAAKNCEFYKKQNDINHYINEVGCLRGMMYLADIIGINYPQDEYYDKYIKHVHEMLGDHD